MKKIVLLWTVLLIIVICMVGCGGTTVSEPAFEPEPEIGLSVGNIAPNFQLEDLDGNLVSLVDLRGKVVFLNFWASWCGPCRSEMPSMEKIYQNYKDKEFEILAVNIQEDQDSVESFIDSKGFSFPVLLDSDGTVARTYQIRGIPTTYIIDSQGVIRKVVLGAADWTSPTYRQIIEDLLSD